MEERTFNFKEIEILDWYDGVVRGLATDEEVTYLIFMAAWKITEQDRIYVIVEIGKERGEEIKRSLNAEREKNKNWRDFSALFDKIVLDLKAGFFLVRGILTEGEQFVATRHTSDEFKRIVPYDIEKTFKKENVNYWYGLLS